MYFRRFLTAHMPFALILCFSILIGGCSEDTVTTLQSEHFEPEGMMIMEGQDTVMYVFQAQFMQGKDTLKAPLTSLTGHWVVKFLGENAIVIDPPSDNQHSLGWTIRDNSVVEVYQDDPQSEPWAFHLRGLRQDTTSMEFLVLHQGHSDFRTPYVKVIIDPCATSVPEGVVIVDEVTGSIIAKDSAGSVSGQITLNVNDSTDHSIVYFLDDEGNRFQPCYPENILASLITDTNIAGFISEAPAEPWVFRIRGIASGQTTISFRIFRGGNFFYGSRLITIQVDP